MLSAVLLVIIYSYLFLSAVAVPHSFDEFRALLDSLHQTIHLNI